MSAAGGAPIATTSFDFPSVGYMHQAVFSFPQCTQGTAYNYTVTSGDSASFSVTPVPARSPSEVFNVFGDFGLINDQVMAELKKEALAGTFDAVLHVGESVVRHTVSGAGCVRASLQAEGARAWVRGACGRGGG